MKTVKATSKNSKGKQANCLNHCQIERPSRGIGLNLASVVLKSSASFLNQILSEKRLNQSGPDNSRQSVENRFKIRELAAPRQSKCYRFLYVIISISYLYPQTSKNDDTREDMQLIER